MFSLQYRYKIILTKILDYGKKDDLRVCLFFCFGRL